MSLLQISIKISNQNTNSLGTLKRMAKKTTNGLMKKIASMIISKEFYLMLLLSCLSWGKP